MKISSLERILQSLNEAHVEYLLAGGLAVAAHGYLRFTADLDLILHLEKNNVLRALKALKNLGYMPRAPVSLESFSDEKERKRWVEEKNLKVFSLWSKKHVATEIDIFAEEPFDFKEMMSHGKKMEVAPGITAMAPSLPDLIALKKAAGRPKDWDDIENLLKINKIH